MHQEFGHVESLVCGVVKIEYMYGVFDTVAGVGRIWVPKHHRTDMDGACKLFTGLPNSEVHTVQVLEVPGNLLNIYERQIHNPDKWKCTHSSN